VTALQTHGVVQRYVKRDGNGEAEEEFGGQVSRGSSIEY